MNIKILTNGRFHHFHLARQLHKRKVLDEIYSNYPRFKLKNESGIPRYKIKTYPYYKVAYLLFNKYLGKIFPSFIDYLNNLSSRKLALKVSKNLKNSTALIATSRSGLEAGRKIKLLNGIFICDRTSSHILFQKKILTKEYKKFNLVFNQISKETISRELSEYKEADLISVPSKFAYNTFIKEGIDKKKLFLNPLGVDLRRFKPRQKKKSTKFIVLYVGQISIRKGIFYLLNAFKKLNIKNKELILIGDVEKKIEKKFFKYLSNEIKHVSDQKKAKSELPKYYSNANVFVLPSIEDGFGLVMTEALACGCPVIATTNTGASSIFKDGKAGFIIKPRSQKEILKSIKKIYRNKKLQKKMSQNAINISKNIGGWDDYGKRIFSKLRKINK
tara:strand:+ start:387 stop:1550 length:1164 start_codon:yes stop_codon:yes gene_type:complete